ncbi:MAG: hypothetical protein K6G15_00965 [Desulfovibrio sp.]|nr:hypothetical protein [Desulfovibrio sp.]
MDIVYVLKEQSRNVDLVYSLRSVQKYVTGYDRIWMAGYRPLWVSNEIPVIRTKQHGIKWQNGRNNLIAACEHPDVSEDFVLFNDDFFALRPVDLRTDLNLCLGSLECAIVKYAKEEGRLTSWKRAFAQAHSLLERLGSEHFENFEIHAPVIFNKTRYLGLIRHPMVADHIKEHKCVLARTLYGNLNWRNPRITRDVKLRSGEDLTEEIASGQWASVYDHVTDHLQKYPRLCLALASLPVSRWERSLIVPPTVVLERMVEDARRDLMFEQHHEGEGG